LLRRKTKKSAALLPALDEGPRYFHCNRPSATNKNKLTKTAQEPTVEKTPYIMRARPLFHAEASKDEPEKRL
jgi:hypothetical protein